MPLRFHLSSCVCVALVPLLLNGCTTKSTQRAEMYLPQKFTTGSVHPLQTNPNVVAWWEDFKDPQLAILIRRGLAQNISLQQARERLDIARIRQAVAGSGGYPQLQVNSTARELGSGTNGKMTRGLSTGGGTQFSWLIDIFGQTRQEKANALANAQAAAADLEAVRLAYLTDIATSYIELQYYRRAVDISGQNLSSYRRTLALTKDMRDAGTASNLDVAQAQALVDGAHAEIPPLQLELQKAINHIATLLGTGSTEISRLIPRYDSQPRLVAYPKIGIPADLLRNRPDIRREERRLAAAAAQIGVAQAQLYPTLTLTGNIDVTRLIVAGVSTSMLGWGFGPSIVAPLLNGGRLRANVDIAKAESRVQYLRWKGTVFQAVEDVENAVVALHRGQAETDALERKVGSYRNALGLARASYEGGTGVVLDVLEADRSLGTARLDLADSIRRNAIDGVRLHIALGGGSAIGSARPR